MVSKVIAPVYLRPFQQPFREWTCPRCLSAILRPNFYRIILVVRNKSHRALSGSLLCPCGESRLGIDSNR